MEKLLIISFILKKVVTDLQDLVSNEEKYIVKLDDQKNFINYIKSQMKVEDGILTLDGGIIITYNYRIISEVSNWDDLPTLWAYLLNSIEELVEEEKSEFYFPSQPINVTLDIYKNDKSKLDFKIENKGFIVGYKTFIQEVLKRAEEFFNILVYELNLVKYDYELKQIEKIRMMYNL
ncbi:hypothetical protein NSS71_05705 [Niallia sp. FSL W8-0951]|uniref:hypothetical protein n=1 Tax=unclassified Niallia TaxID=2837522 RepID=UPI0030F51890